MNTLVKWLRRRIRRGQPNRYVSIWLPLLLIAIEVPVAFAQHVANPFAGATQYVNPDYTKEVNSAIASLPAGSTPAMAAMRSSHTAVGYVATTDIWFASVEPAGKLAIAELTSLV